MSGVEIMTLSKIISKLERNESVKFVGQVDAIRVVIKKGDHPRNNKTIALSIRRSDIEQCAMDIIELEVDRALKMARTRN
jgi:hypothetical protein